MIKYIILIIIIAVPVFAFDDRVDYIAEKQAGRVTMSKTNGIIEVVEQRYDYRTGLRIADVIAKISVKNLQREKEYAERERAMMLERFDLQIQSLIGMIKDAEALQVD